MHNLDPALEYFMPDARWHGGILGIVDGADKIAELLLGFIGALLDLHATEQDMVVEGDTVAVRLVVEATHQGNLFDIPATGRRVRWDAVDIFRLADGKVAEEWALDDVANISYEVGALNPPCLK